MPSSDFMGIF